MARRRRGCRCSRRGAQRARGRPADVGHHHQVGEQARARAAIARRYAFLEKLSEDATLPGLHIEPIQNSVDHRVRTGRVDQGYRAVMFQLDARRRASTTSCTASGRTTTRSRWRRRCGSRSTRSPGSPEIIEKGRGRRAERAAADVPAVDPSRMRDVPIPLLAALRLRHRGISRTTSGSSTRFAEHVLAAPRRGQPARDRGDGRRRSGRDLPLSTSPPERRSATSATSSGWRPRRTTDAQSDEALVEAPQAARRSADLRVDRVERGTGAGRQRGRLRSLAGLPPPGAATVRRPGLQGSGPGDRRGGHRQDRRRPAPGPMLSPDASPLLVCSSPRSRGTSPTC